MNTIKELFEYFNKKNIRIFSSRNPEVTCISGQYAELMENVSEIIDYEIEFWQSFYNNRWTTFIKNVDEDGDLMDDYEDNHERYNDYEDDYHPDELKQMEMDAWEYDGDPNDFDECGRPGY